MNPVSLFFIREQKERKERRIKLAGDTSKWYCFFSYIQKVVKCLIRRKPKWKTSRNEMSGGSR
jgi:hypothetical protein